jgi:hypothetical protein
VENSIEDRVELNDLNKCRKEMLQALADFKEHSRMLSDLSVQEDKVHFANVRFIKNQVRRGFIKYRYKRDSASRLKIPTLEASRV